MKMKEQDIKAQDIKALGISAGIVYGIIVLMMGHMIWNFYQNSDSYLFRHTLRVRTKEKICGMVIDRQDALERMVSEMEEACLKEGKGQLYVNRSMQDKKELKTLYALEFFYPIRAVWIPASSDGGREVRAEFGFKPEGVRSWGIYYSANGEPRGWKGGEVEKQGDVYVEDEGDFYRYETEHIVDNWYFYQCDD